MPGGAHRHVIAAFSLALLVAGCKRCSPPEAHELAHVDAETLPAGCQVAARVETATFAAVLEALRAAVSSDGQRSAFSGVDLSRQVRAVSYCKLPQVPGKKPSFVLVLAGAMSLDMLEAAVARQGGMARHDAVDGHPAIATSGVWLAQRTVGGRASEVIVATDRDLLRTALSGAAGHYAIDRAVPFSMVIDGATLATALPAIEGAERERADLRAVKDVVVTVAPGASLLATRFEIGDPSTAERLAAGFGPMLTELASRTLRSAGAGTKPTTEVEGGDLVIRLALPNGLVDDLAARLVARSRVR